MTGPTHRRRIRELALVAALLTSCGGSTAPNADATQSQQARLPVRVESSEPEGPQTQPSETVGVSEQTPMAEPPPVEPPSWNE